jgi:tetratricopeptide (TPR) repeat protein
MGDVYRAQNNLGAARAEYARMAELDPSRALAFQQRGHVNAFLGNFAEARADYDRAISLGDPDEKASYAVYRALTHVHAGDPAAAARELDQLVTTIDGMNLPGAVGAKIFALDTQLQIALHHRHLDVAERAVDRLRVLWRQQAEMGQTADFRRRREADIAFREGLLAAYKGDYATARSKAQQYMQLREGDNNPRRNEPAHELLGLVELLQRNYAAAVTHFEQGDPNDPYVTYHKALALEGAGRTAEARELFRRVAANNFNSPGLALTKRDAARRAG